LVERIWEKKGLELGLVNDVTKKYDLTRIRGDRLPTFKDGKQAKQERKLMKIKLFEQWLLNHPRV
jgi:hypothetical protein